MSTSALNKVLAHAAAGSEAREAFFASNSEALVILGRELAKSIATGHKLLLCGNGGSAADCQHLAAEFVNRFKIDRPPLPAIALTTDTSALTAIGNDFGYDQIFLKQVQALATAGDVLLGISTSGTSPNVIIALKEAKQKGCITIGMTGQSEGEMPALCDYMIAIPSSDTAIIQELHIAAGHILCHLVDHFLFEAATELTPYL